MQTAEADVDGIYVTLTRSLPDSIVVSADQVIILREIASVTPPTMDSSANLTEKEGTVIPTDSETSEKTQQSESEKTVEVQENDAEKQEGNEKEQESNSVKWDFPNGQAQESFTAEAVVRLISETKVSVDFAYSGPLPEGTEVTVNILKDNVSYQEGDTLYFYYCNPETGQHDFVSEGKYQDSQVTFKINHCSEYVITNMPPNVSERSDVSDMAKDAEDTDEDMSGWIIPVLFGMIACGVVGVVIFKRKK